MADIVVGVDGSDCSYEALAWAVDEGARRHASVEAVYAWQLPLVPSFTAHPTPLLAERVALSHGAEREVQAFVDRVVAERADAPGAGGVPPAVTARAVLGRAVDALLGTPADGSSLLVVGAHGHGMLDRLLLGSVSTAVLNRAETDVVVVRGEPRPAGAPRVVVGFDGSPQARWALAVGAREALARDAQLHVVRVWSWVTAPHLGPARDTWAGLDEAERSTDEELQKAVSDLPHLSDLRTQLVHGYEPARELVAAGQGAQLLVLGSRGLGAVRSLLLGSTSHECVQHAPCPVLVVRTAAF